MQYLSRSSYRRRAPNWLPLHPSATDLWCAVDNTSFSVFSDNFGFFLLKMTEEQEDLEKCSENEENLDNLVNQERCSLRDEKSKEDAGKFRVIWTAKRCFFEKFSTVCLSRRVRAREFCIDRGRVRVSYLKFSAEQVSINIWLCYLYCLQSLVRLKKIYVVQIILKYKVNVSSEET